MRRSLGVIRKLGYTTIEEFRTKNHPHHIPKNIIIGIEETGHHTLYSTEESWQRERTYFNDIEKLIQETNPSFVLIVGEDVYVENVERSLENPPVYTLEAPLWEFARRVRNQNRVPLVIASFGR